MTPTRKGLQGVGGRLFAAFSAVAAVAIAVAALASYLLAATNAQVERVGGALTPRMVATAGLSEATNALLAETPLVLAVETEAALRAQWKRVSDAEAAVGRALRGLSALAPEDRGLTALGEEIGRLSADLQILLSATERALALRERRAALDAQVDVLNQEFSLLVDFLAETDGSLGALSAANRLLVLLSETGRIRRVADLGPHGERIANAYASVRGLSRFERGDPLDIFVNRLRFVSRDAGNVVDLRRDELIAQAVASGRLRALNERRAEIDRAVSERLAAAQADIAREQAATARRTRQGQIAMAAAGGLSVALVVLLGWRFVRRRITDRIAALSASMRMIAAGDFDAPVPRGGADEIADMGEALAVFREAMADVAAANARAAAARRLLDDALANISDGLALADADGRLVLTNRKFRVYLPEAEDLAARGETLETLARRAVESGRIARQIGPHPAEADPAAWGINRGQFSVELDDRSCLRATVRRMSDGGRVFVLSDITEERRSRERAEHLASHDPLTGLANRYLAEQRLEECVAEGRAGAAFVIQIMGLGDISETFGHLAIDQAIGASAVRLTKAARPGELPTRIDRDVFAMIAPGVVEDEAVLARARELRDGLARPVMVHGLEVKLRPAVGASCFPRDGAVPVALLMQAEVAATRAKASSALTPRLYDAELGAETRARQSIRSEMRRAIFDHRISPFYQPKLRLADDVVAGMEALARWPDSSQGPVSPGVFVPIAESSGLIAELGVSILRQACRQTAAWNGRGAGLRVAVNVSPAQLVGQDLPRIVAETLRETGLAPDTLELEITETVMLNDDDTVITRLRALRELGVSLAIDDFGTGYSSLSYLKRLPVTELKIDQTFVRELRLSDREDVRLVRSIITIARDFGLGVVAEGVETQEQLDFLRAEGCHYAQGYLIAKPLAPDGFEAFIGAPAEPPALSAGAVA